MLILPHHFANCNAGLRNSGLTKALLTHYVSLASAVKCAGSAGKSL